MSKLNTLTNEELNQHIELKILNDRLNREEYRTETNLLIHRLTIERANLLTERTAWLLERETLVNEISKLKQKLVYCKFNLKHISETID